MLSTTQNNFKRLSKESLFYILLAVCGSILYNVYGDLMKKVIIGMSGGVDSSVAAYLLKKDGYDVIGVTLQLCSNGEEDINLAKDVCNKLCIEHIVLDRREAFRKTVISDFISTYEKGGTPNPCVLCNRVIKFEEMLRFANEIGADFVATGHYCKIINKDGRYLIKRPADLSKDQTYMLYKLTQEQLKRTLMPLSDYTKEQVREIAAKIGISTADRPDSQDICFVPDSDYKGFIEKYTNKKYPEGDFISVDNKVIGRHRGIIGYTIGQRKGLGIALGKPAFVISKNVADNTVTLSENEDLLYSDTVKVKDINLIPFDSFEGQLRVEAKLRYRHKESPATLTLTGENEGVLVFDEKQRAAAKGQAAVFYCDDILIGGGTIV